MQVRSVMTPNPVTTRPEATVREAAALMREHHIGGLPVLAGDHLAGIITESDILRLLETGKISDDLWLPSPLEIIEVPIREIINWEKTRKALSSIGDTQVQDVMHHPVYTVTPEIGIEDAASCMLRHRIARLPVMEEGKLVGIVTRRDIVEGIAGGTGA